MEFATTQAFVKSLEGVVESGILEEPLLSDVKTMIALSYEKGDVYDSIKYMDTKGTATLNRQMLLNTIACAKTRMTNSNENCTIDFVIADIVVVSRFPHLRLSH